MTTAYQISFVQSASGELSLENHTEIAEGHEKSLAENPNIYYTPLYYLDKFTMSSPNSDVT